MINVLGKRGLDNRGYTVSASGKLMKSAYYQENRRSTWIKFENGDGFQVLEHVCAMLKNYADFYD